MKVESLCATGFGSSIKKHLKFIHLDIQDPGPDDVLIEVHAASINPVDYKLINGPMRFVKKLNVPFPLGFDLSGKVVKKGTNVSDLSVGDEVYSKVPWEQLGTIMTHTVVNSKMVSLKPRNLNFTEAASLPLAGCTVLDAFQIAGVKGGDKILILAGSGGTGTFAIQYAKYLGAFVYTTTSTTNVNWVKQLGADVVIDYQKEEFSDVVKDVDIVFDTLGGNYTYRAIKILKKGGKLLAISGHVDEETLSMLKVSQAVKLFFKLKHFRLHSQIRKKNIFYKFVWSFPSKESLNSIRELAEKSIIKPVIEKEYQFKEAIEAVMHVKTNRTKGKVVIKIK